MGGSKEASLRMRLVKGKDEELLATVAQEFTPDSDELPEDVRELVRR